MMERAALVNTSMAIASSSSSSSMPTTTTFATSRTIRFHLCTNQQLGFYSCVNARPPRLFQIYCSDSKSKRGFGSQRPQKTNKITTSTEGKGEVLPQRKSTTKESGAAPTRAPGLSSRFDGRNNNVSMDIDFEERLEAVRRSALEQKQSIEKKYIGPIDYDAPVEPEQKTIGLGTKIGVGVAVVVFGLVFALGDFLPSGSVSPTDEAAVVNNKLSEKEKAALQWKSEIKKWVTRTKLMLMNRLKQYEAALSISPKDPTALEGAAVTLAELGEYTRAGSLLEDLIKEKPSDPDSFRLLGEVRYGLKDYEGSVAAYKSSAKLSNTIDFDVLRGLTNALLASEKPDEAVRILLAARERLSTEESNDSIKRADSSTNTEMQKVDSIQVELLLGKAYSDWGHISDAVSVYDGLIFSHPDDFRGYLAKGIILKENGNVGDAERMFIQARFFAPENAKALVDRYARK